MTSPSLWIVKIMATIGIALAILISVACTRPQPPVRVGTVPWPPYDLLELASEEHRLDPDIVELIHLETPAEVVRAFRYELIDAMLVTSHFALSAGSTLPGTRIIYFVDVSVGGDALLARPEIKNASDLRGKRVGIEAAPLGTYTLTRALQILDVDRKHIDIVEVDTPEHYEAFATGRIDALVTYDPVRARLVEEGANQLFGSEQIPFEIIDVIVARSEVIEDRPLALAALINAFSAGIQEFRNNPGAARALAERHGLSPEAYLNSLESVQLYDLDQNLEFFADPEGPVQQGLLEQCNIMVNQGLFVRAPALDPLLDASIADLADQL